MRLITHHESETPRSIQLYGVDPATVEGAVRVLVDEDRADHIDLNFGCPVPKVTRKGGGAALPWKLELFRDIVTRAARAAGDIPLTVKMRKGIDSDHLTYLDAGRIAEDAGVAAVALHARTAAEFYSGQADWSAIAALKQAVTSVPVLGNGDIWSAEDAARMMVGDGLRRRRRRSRLSRTPLALRRSRPRSRAAGAAPGEPVTPLSVSSLRRSGVTPNSWWSSSTTRAAAAVTSESTSPGTSRATPWAAIPARLLATVSSLDDIDRLIETLDLEAGYPGQAAEGQRGRAGTPKRPALPDGWLDSRDLGVEATVALADAELHHSGG